MHNFSSWIIQNMSLTKIKAGVLIYIEYCHFPSHVHIWRLLLIISSVTPLASPHIIWYIFRICYLKKRKFIYNCLSRDFWVSQDYVNFNLTNWIYVNIIHHHFIKWSLDYIVEANKVNINFTIGFMHLAFFLGEYPITTQMHKVNWVHHRNVTSLVDVWDMTHWENYAFIYCNCFVCRSISVLFFSIRNVCCMCPIKPWGSSFSWMYS